MRLALLKEMRIDMKLKHLAKLCHGHAHPSVIKTGTPTQPACRNDITTQELINEINALSMD
jgi:hypothetical protein